MQSEAVAIHYSEIIITSVSTWNINWDEPVLEFLWPFYHGTLDDICSTCINGFQQAWAAAHLDLVRDVGKIFDLDTGNLPAWLFFDFVRAGNRNLCITYEFGLGRQFPAFLRQIGRANTGLIRVIELVFEDLSRSAKLLPVYAEIIMQHIPHLRRLMIGELQIIAL